MSSRHQLHDEVNALARNLKGLIQPLVDHPSRVFVRVQEYENKWLLSVQTKGQHDQVEDALPVLRQYAEILNESRRGRSTRLKGIEIDLLLDGE